MERIAPEGALRKMGQYASVRQCETTMVTVEVVDLAHLSGRGKLIGLAAVEIVLDGVSVVTQGWRLMKRADGLTIVEPPVYRHSDGDLVPAVVLPEELEEAVARAVLEEAGAFLLVTG